jgi:replicative DNA helicase
MTDYEECFLACVLLTPAILFKTKLREQHFLSPNPRRLYRAMLDCSAEGIQVDYISVNERDKDMDPTYAVRLSNMVPSSANWKFYEGEIVKSYKRHKLIRLGKMFSEITDQSDPVEYIERAEVELLELAAGINNTEIVHIRDAISPTLKKIEERYKNKGRLAGLSSGLNALDAMTCGFLPGRYYVIGARPSDGKSALAVNIITHLGIREHARVGLISAESGNDEIVTRMFSSEGHINGQAINSGALRPSDFTSIMEAGERMRNAPIYLYDAPNVKYSEMRGVARQMVMTYKIQALFIDYLQLVQWENQSLAIHEQVAKVSISIKELARELKIPIIALSQLKRDSEGREPEMSDLDYSKQIEQDADCIVLIYHPKVKEKEEPRDSMLLVKKNRDGPKGAIFVNFRREYVRFYESERSR